MKSFQEEEKERERKIKWMEAGLAEARKIDIRTFSPRMQQIIEEYHQKMEAEERARETDLERIKRIYPHLPEDECIHLLFLSIVAGKRLEK